MAEQAFHVSSRAWSELLHAEVGLLLRRAGIPVLHIKGPTVVLWLYEPGERPWGDVDVLVAPSRMEEALAVLDAAGMPGVFAGVTPRTTTDHAITVGRREMGGQVSEVDVHSRFEGIDADPERAFARLWRRREPARLAHTDVWFPDLPTRALLIALNTARTPSVQARGDLSRLVMASSDEDWQAVIALGRAVNALPALRTGLEIDVAGRDVVARTVLAQVPASLEAGLRVAGAPRTAVRLAELSHVPWPRRPAVVGRWLIPAPAVLRMRDPAAAVGSGALALAYARRLMDGARALAPSVAALAAQRRLRRRSRGGRAGRVR